MCVSHSLPSAGAAAPLRGLVGFPPRWRARRGAAVAFAATDATAAAVAHRWPACLPLARAWLLAVIAAIAAPAAAQPAGVPDHDEFSAWLETPYRSGDARARRFVLTFEHPAAAPGERVDWHLELRAPDGRVAGRWRGSATLAHGAGRQEVAWRASRGAPGIYRARMVAAPRGAADAAIEQERPLVVGAARPGGIAAPRPAGSGAAGPAVRTAPDTGAPLAWDIYLGNLHSQTGHSDGGVPVGHCHGGSQPGTMPAGPADAYAFAHRHGLDFLLTSEHNHMYDGSGGSNPQADPEAARRLYRRGLAEAAAFTAQHPGFVALHGLEWGVIANGGHVNVLGGQELLGWERNADGEVIGDTYTAKGDYAALYELLAQRGWLGQFNHPGERQFHAAGKPLGYVPHADAAMALCEVMNSAAFSHRTDEGETRMGSHEGACRRALEAGWHVALTSNQDNHCANWGAAAPNRTGVLLPRGTPFTAAALLDALRARRVFATMDKGASLVLTAGGHVMGERIANRGTLTLSASHRSATGRAIDELVIVFGVPGREGVAETMTLAATTVTVAPPPGEHYYYARLTQDDGSMLWSAPIWVTQQAARQR